MSIKPVLLPKLILSINPAVPLTECSGGARGGGGGGGGGGPGVPGQAPRPGVPGQAPRTRQVHNKLICTI